jgi:hypothetical protein
MKAIWLLFSKLIRDTKLCDDQMKTNMILNKKKSEHKQVAKLTTIFWMNVIYVYCIEVD